MTNSPERYQRLRRALDGVSLPAALVDLDAFERNVARARATVTRAGVTLRVGSKSVRCTDLLKRILSGLGDRAGGVLAFTASEARHLVAAGLRDIVVAYPTPRRVDADVLAACNRDGARVAAMVDATDQLDVLAGAARAANTVIPVVVDVDMSWRPPGLDASVVLGVRRSPLYTAAAVVDVARAVDATAGLRFAGVMGYEAQLAGLADRDARGRRIAQSALVKALSRPQVRARRRAVRDALTAAGLTPALFNGGGTGSLAWSTGDVALTEVSAGSAFVGGTLFDGMDEFAPEPALCFALPVCRHPAPGIVTCLGGGYVASGTPGWERLPTPWLPEGIALLAWEGAGEVQTPLRVPAGVTFAVGDPVFFRHAKAGELAERFAEYLLVRGDVIESRVPTYRGEGRCFL